MRLYSVQEAGDFFRVSPHTIRSWIRNGKLPHVKAGRRVLLLAEDLERALLVWRRSAQKKKGD